MTSKLPINQESHLRPVLRSPVKKRIYVDEWFPGCDFKAGESALEELTMLGSWRHAAWATAS
jgi:hypothetical protein